MNAFVSTLANDDMVMMNLRLLAPRPEQVGLR
jgi:hypothetical protein